MRSASVSQVRRKVPIGGGTMGMSCDATSSPIIPAPLGIGTIELADGSRVQAFVCTQTIARGARDISEFGGWRNFTASQQR